MKMIAFRKIAVTWSARLLVMNRRLEIAHLRSQIRRPFNGIAHDKMFDVDREKINSQELRSTLRPYGLHAYRCLFRRLIWTHWERLNIEWPRLCSLGGLHIPKGPPTASSTTENSWIHTVGFPHYSGAKHSRERSGSGSRFIIAFVESSRRLMDNHRKVDIKMDYLTPQTDNNSFIILRLAVALSLKPGGPHVSRRGRSSANILIFDALNNLFLFYCHVKAAVVGSDSQSSVHLSRPSQWHQRGWTVWWSHCWASCCFLSSVSMAARRQNQCFSHVWLLFLFPLQSNRILPELLQRLHVTDRHGLQRLLPPLLWPASKFDAPVPENTDGFFLLANDNASLDLMPRQKYPAWRNT